MLSNAFDCIKCTFVVYGATPQSPSISCMSDDLWWFESHPAEEEHNLDVVDCPTKSFIPLLQAFKKQYI